MIKIKSYLKLMRVHHYIKNLLIFAALACSGQFFDISKLCKGILGYLAFCLMTSVVYIINDLKDIENDRNHPTKCNRPLASGRIGVKEGILIAILLFGLSLAINYFTAVSISYLWLLLYMAINIVYSLGAKNISLLDLVILVSGFVVRVIFGAVITDIVISSWLYLTVIAIAFYFALGKRRNEITKTKGQNTRKVLKAYTVDFLDKNMYMCLTLANMFYALWTMDKSSAGELNNQYMIFTVPLVLIITMKYSMNIESDSDGDPVEVLLHDRVLLGLCAIYAVVMFAILYL